MTEGLDVMIAEDEQLAREHLEHLVASTSGLRLVASVADGASALRALDEFRPAGLFLDVKMPHLSGVDVLRQAEHGPAVVFTTAFDTFAVNAFELGAIDYLLKPFGEDRFRDAVGRLRRAVARPSAIRAEARLQAVAGSSPLNRCFVREGDRLLPLALADVIRLSAAKDHTEIHVSGAEYLVRIPISELEARCDPDTFVRVHRSHLVNLAHVRQVTVDDEGRHVVHLDDGVSIVASRSGARRLRNLVL